MVGEASGRMQKADCRDEIALPAAMLAWLKCGKQRVLHFFLGDFNKRTNLHRSATA